MHSKDTAAGKSSTGRRGLALGVLGLVLFLSGCATTADILTPGAGHRLRADEFRAAVASQQPSRLLRAAERAGDRSDARDGVLYSMEQGRLLSLAGEVERGIRAYQFAADRFDAERARPVVAVSSGFYNAAALATNDLALPYATPPHERLMVYNFLALDHVRQGRLDFAQIALNAGDAEQAYWREHYAALEAETDRRAQQAGFGRGAIEGAIDEVQARLRADAQTALRPYQSALNPYLMGLLFAVEGDRDRSVIALRKAGELYPDHPYVVEALRERGVRAAADDAVIVVVDAAGLVPARETLALPFFWDRTILQVVLPVYPAGGTAYGGGGSLQLRLDGEALGETALIADLAGQARQQLADRYPALFLRQVLRLVAKYQIQQRLERENPWAGLAAQVFNLLTDKADDRSWLTLPARIGVAHFSVAPGRHQLAFAGGGAAIEAGTVELPPGSTLFALVNRVGPATYHDFLLFDADGQPRHITDPTLQGASLP